MGLPCPPAINSAKRLLARVVATETPGQTGPLCLAGPERTPGQARARLGAQEAGLRKRNREEPQAGCPAAASVGWEQHFHQPSRCRSACHLSEHGLGRGYQLLFASCHPHRVCCHIVCSTDSGSVAHSVLAFLYSICLDTKMTVRRMRVGG